MVALSRPWIDQRRVGGGVVGQQGKEQQGIPPNDVQNLAHLELELLGLKVSGGVKVERVTLRGIGEEILILVNLKKERKYN